MGNRWLAHERALHEPRLAEARSRLGGPEWEEALAEGKTMTLEQAVAYALGEGAEAKG